MSEHLRRTRHRFEGWIIGDVDGGRAIAHEVVLAEAGDGRFELVIGVNEDDFDPYVVPLSPSAGRQFLDAMGPQPE